MIHCHQNLSKMFWWWFIRIVKANNQLQLLFWTGNTILIRVVSHISLLKVIHLILLKLFSLHLHIPHNVYNVGEALCTENFKVAWSLKNEGHCGTKGACFVGSHLLDKIQRWWLTRTVVDDFVLTDQAMNLGHWLLQYVRKVIQWILDHQLQERFSCILASRITDKVHYVLYFYEYKIAKGETRNNNSRYRLVVYRRRENFKFLEIREFLAVAQWICKAVKIQDYSKLFNILCITNHTQRYTVVSTSC